MTYLTKLIRSGAFLPIAVGVIVLGVSCYVQGMWSERWGTFPELKIYSDQLAQIPLDFGEWQGKNEEGSDAKILKIAGAEGELVRTYRNAAGEEVRVSIICARLQDVFYHTPERCYPAAGFEMEGEPQQETFEIGNTQAQFFTTSFMKSEPTGTHKERGFWSWSADGTWVAPKNYKLQFAGQKALYKLYIFGALPVSKQQKSSTDEEYTRKFIRAFVPVLEDALSPAIQKAKGGAATAQTAPASPAETKPSA